SHDNARLPTASPDLPFPQYSGSSGQIGSNAGRPPVQEQVVEIWQQLDWARWHRLRLWIVRRHLTFHRSCCFADLIIEAITLRICDCRLAAGKREPQLSHRIGAAGPAHQRLDEWRGLRLEFEQPTFRAGTT